MLKFLTDETGLELSEYAVATALIAATVVVTFTALGNVVSEKIELLVASING